MRPKEKSLPSWQIALRLLVICVLAALLLTAVNAVTAPRIEAQNQAKILGAVQSLFPTCDSTEIKETKVAVDALYCAKAGETVLGYCVLVTGNGYGSGLQLMVGYDLQGNLTQVLPVSHTETKGIGDKALSEEYLSQYIGKSGSLTLNQEIDGVSGATLTSKGVLACVNLANQAIAEVIS